MFFFFIIESNESRMPLVILTGFPCSGKTKRVDELKKYFEECKGRSVRVIDDEFAEVDRQSTYHGKLGNKLKNLVTLFFFPSSTITVNLNSTLSHEEGSLVGISLINSLAFAQKTLVKTIKNA